MKTKQILMSLALATAVASPAFATEYQCSANGLSAYLVFDDGPGGLDYLDLKFGGKQYTVSGDAGPNIVAAEDSDTPDGKFEYAGSSLDLEIKGKDGKTFVLRAEHQGNRNFMGSVTVGRQVLKMTCKTN